MRLVQFDLGRIFLLYSLAGFPRLGIEAGRFSFLQYGRNSARYIHKEDIMPVDFEYPELGKVLGLSTSHYTNVVDWKIARENGVKFAYIKAQNGINNPVRFWKENYEGAKKEGIKVGGYTWLYPASVASPGTQARKFAEFAKIFPCELPWCVDYEWTTPSNPDISDLWGFVQPFEVEHGKKPAIYTAPGYWNEFGSKNPLWGLYPLWQAQYNHGQADNMPPWESYKFIQWSQTGRGLDYGVPTIGEIACELNYYNGSLEQFNAEFGEVAMPPQGEKDMFEMTTISSGTRIRTDHNTFAALVTSVGAGVVVRGDEVWTALSDGSEVKAGDKWLHVTEAGRVGWMAYIHKGNPICRDLIEIGTPPNPPSSTTYTVTLEDDVTHEIYKGTLTKQ